MKGGILKEKYDQTYGHVSGLIKLISKILNQIINYDVYRKKNNGGEL